MRSAHLAAAVRKKFACKKTECVGSNDRPLQ
jgi:hypothetical protein